MRYIIVHAAEGVWSVIDTQKSRVICQCTGYYGRRYATEIAARFNTSHDQIMDMFMPKEN